MLSRARRVKSSRIASGLCRPVLHRHPDGQVRQGIVRARLVGDDVDPDAAGEQFGKNLAALPRGRPTGPRPLAGGAHPSIAVSEIVGDLVEIAVRRRRSRRARSTSTMSTAPPFMVTRGAAPPPMPPQPAVRVRVPASDSRPHRGCHRGEGLVGALQDPLRPDVDPHPAVIWPYIVRPSSSSRRNSGHVAQSPTRLELAMSTRGAHSCVRKTPTGLPDCTAASRRARARRACATIAS